MIGTVPRPAVLDRLAMLADDAASVPGWGGLAAYLRLRGAGLRRDALCTLDGFVNEAVAWSFDERLALLRWIVSRSIETSDPALPQPLHARVVAPTVAEWLVRDPGSSEAHLLHAIYGPRGDPTHNPMRLVRRAVELDPANQAARETFVSWAAGDVEHAQHELPWGYLGSAEDDARNLEEALVVAAGITHKAIHDRTMRELRELLAVARAWAAFHAEGRPDAFAGWYAVRA